MKPWQEPDHSFEASDVVRCGVHSPDLVAMRGAHQWSSLTEASTSVSQIHIPVLEAL